MSGSWSRYLSVGRLELPPCSEERYTSVVHTFIGLSIVAINKFPHQLLVVASERNRSPQGETERKHLTKILVRTLCHGPPDQRSAWNMEEEEEHIRAERHQHDQEIWDEMGSDPAQNIREVGLATYRYLTGIECRLCFSFLKDLLFQIKVNDLIACFKKLKI